MKGSQLSKPFFQALVCMAGPLWVLSAHLSLISPTEYYSVALHLLTHLLLFLGTL